MMIQDVLNNIPTLDLVNFYLPKIVMATICGGAVGIEREMKHKVAGIKTNIMICVGSTLFAATAFLISQLNPSIDPSRIISYIVSGIGFLGAGAIFRGSEKIRGLTSAALIWILAAIGIMIAAGGYIVSLMITIGLIALIIASSHIEKKLFPEEHK